VTLGREAATVMLGHGVVKAHSRICCDWPNCWRRRWWLPRQYDANCSVHNERSISG
jgi:hypothetical protein